MMNKTIEVQANRHPILSQCPHCRGAEREHLRRELRRLEQDGDEEGLRELLRYMQNVGYPTMDGPEKLCPQHGGRFDA